MVGRSERVLRFGVCVWAEILYRFLRSTFEAILNGPRQFLLTLQLDMGVVIGHVDAAVASDLDVLAVVRSHFLPPGVLARRSECKPKPGKSQPAP